MIPPLIHQTFIGSILPLEIGKVISSNQQICKHSSPALNPLFLFYDDAKCDTIIAKFGERIHTAYRGINPHLGAMKSDFFRYCVLFLFGGIYMDIKTKLLVNPFVLFHAKNEMCILDLKRNNLESWRGQKPTYEQWMLIFCPRHPYLMEMIMHMVSCIEGKIIPPGLENASTKKKILHITGPDAFTKVLDNFVVLKNKGVSLHKCIDFNYFFKYNVLGNYYKRIYKPYNRHHYADYQSSESLYILIN